MAVTLLVFVVAGAAPTLSSPAAADQVLVRGSALTAAVDDDFRCGPNVRIKVVAQSDAAFVGEKAEVKGLLRRVRQILPRKFDCPELLGALVTGWVHGRQVYQGVSDVASSWALVDQFGPAGTVSTSQGQGTHTAATGTTQTSTARTSTAQAGTSQASAQRPIDPFSQYHDPVATSRKPPLDPAPPMPTTPDYGTNAQQTPIGDRGPADPSVVATPAPDLQPAPPQPPVSAPPVATRSATNDPFQLFIDADKRPTVPQGQGSQHPTAALPVQPVYCSGNLNSYIGKSYQNTVQFEFVAQVQRSAKTMKVRHVIKGPLYQSGQVYKIVASTSDVLTIQAESSDATMIFTTLSLFLPADLTQGRLTGKGSVNYSDKRKRLFSALDKFGMRLPENSRLRSQGLDRLRRVEVDGHCATQ